jgi:hypothetical protein
MAWELHGMGELTCHGKAAERHGMCGLTCHGKAGERHGLCELALVEVDCFGALWNDMHLLI